jgi:hypothetical protein
VSFVTFPSESPRRIRPVPERHHPSPSKTGRGRPSLGSGVSIAAQRAKRGANYYWQSVYPNRNETSDGAGYSSLVGASKERLDRVETGFGFAWGTSTRASGWARVNLLILRAAAAEAPQRRRKGTNGEIDGGQTCFGTGSCVLGVALSSDDRSYSAGSKIQPRPQTWPTTFFSVASPSLRVCWTWKAATGSTTAADNGTEAPSYARTTGSIGAALRNVGWQRGFGSGSRDQLDQDAKRGLSRLERKVSTHVEIFRV